VLFCVKFSFYYTKPRDWLGERLGNDLFCVCRVGCKTLTQSITPGLIVVLAFEIKTLV